jgi:hypothetical protein
MEADLLEGLRWPHFRFQTCDFMVAVTAGLGILYIFVHIGGNGDRSRSLKAMAQVANPGSFGNIGMPCGDSVAAGMKHQGLAFAVLILLHLAD